MKGRPAQEAVFVHWCISTPSGMERSRCNLLDGRMPDKNSRVEIDKAAPVVSCTKETHRSTTSLMLDTVSVCYCSQPFSECEFHHLLTRSLPSSTRTRRARSPSATSRESPRSQPPARATHRFPGPVAGKLLPAICVDPALLRECVAILNLRLASVGAAREP